MPASCLPAYNVRHCTIRCRNSLLRRIPPGNAANEKEEEGGVKASIEPRHGNPYYKLIGNLLLVGLGN